MGIAYVVTSANGITILVLLRMGIPVGIIAMGLSLTVMMDGTTVTGLLQTAIPTGVTIMVL